MLADPPYSKKDAEKYGTKYPNKAKVMRELYSIVSPGGVLVWLDTRRPIYRRNMWDFVGLIALDCGTNRLLRGVFLFTPKKTSFRGRKFWLKFYSPSLKSDVKQDSCLDFLFRSYWW